MNYGQAKEALLRRRPADGTDEASRAEESKYFEDRDQAQGVVVLSIAENLERIANALEKSK